MSDAGKYERTERASVPFNLTEIYQLFFDEGPDCMMATDPHGHLTVVNRRGRELTGYSGNELSGMTITDLINQEETALNRFCMDDLQVGRNFTTECTIVSKDGRQIPVEIIIWKHHGGILLITVRDITGRVQAELSGQKLQQQLLSIIEFLPDATFVIDQDKQIIAWNRACELMTGVTKDAMVGYGDFAYSEPFFGDRRPILIDLLDLPSPELEANYKYVKRMGCSIYAESFIPRLRDGNGAHLWGVAAPLFDQAGQRCGAVESIRDVTEQKQIEQELREGELKYRTLFEGEAGILVPLVVSGVGWEGRREANIFR